MKAVRLHSFGGPDVLRYEDVPDPEPAENDVLVKIESIGVNFVDTYYRTGAYAAKLPLVPGMEAVGTVVSGATVGPVQVGARVGFAMQLGAYAEYIALPADRLVPIPVEIPSDLAAASLIQGMTAQFLAFDIRHFQAGETVLVHAAAGGLGQLLTQMLKLQGVRVVGTTSTPEKAAVAVAAGVEHVILYGQSDFVVEVAKLTAGEGVSVVFDSVGSHTWRGSLECLRPRGLLVLCGQSSGPVPPIDPQLLRTGGSVGLYRPSLHHYIADHGELIDRASSLFALIAEQKIRVHIQQRLALSDAAKGQEILESRRSTGKVLLTPDHTETALV